jgi:hypothetical protein
MVGDVVTLAFQWKKLLAARLIPAQEGWGHDGV